MTLSERAMGQRGSRGLGIPTEATVVQDRSVVNVYSRYCICSDNLAHRDVGFTGGGWRMRWSAKWLAGLVVATLVAGTAAAVPTYIAVAVANPARPAADRQRDDARKPAP
jgi:hypothetical protein